MSNIFNRKLIGVLAGLLVGGLCFVFYMLGINERLVMGSTIQGNDYIATSTAANSVFGASQGGDRTIKTGQGALGSVIVTGANTGIVNFYDATTTNVNLRTNNTPTTTILIASLPASIVAGTYIFDAEFADGLTISVFSGTVPTTTITYR